MTIRVVPADMVEEAKRAAKLDFLESVNRQEHAAFMRVDTLEATAFDTARRAEKARERAADWWA